MVLCSSLLLNYIIYYRYKNITIGLLISLKKNFGTGKKDSLDAATESIIFSAISGTMSGLICGLGIWEYLLMINTIVNAPFAIAEKRFVLESSPYKGVLEYISKTHRKEGFGTFLRGAGPRMVRSGLDAMIAFTTFDFMSQILKEV